MGWGRQSVDDRLDLRPRTADTLARLARCGRVGVVDALFDLAADADLHRVGGRHGRQAARAVQQLRQPVRPVLGPAVRHHRHLCGVRRMVVPADPGVPRHLDQPVHRAQCAEDRRRPEEPEGAPARAVAAGVPPQGARPRGRAARRSLRTHRRIAVGQWLERQGRRARQRHHGRGAQGLGEPARLPGRAQRDRAHLPRRPGRRQPHRARADGAARQERVRRRRHAQGHSGGAPPRQLHADLPRQPAGARRRARRHRGAESRRRRGAAGAAVRRRAEEIHRRVLRHRHAEAVRERDRHPRSRQRPGDTGHGEGERAGAPSRRRDLPEQLRRRRLRASRCARFRSTPRPSRSPSKAPSAPARGCRTGRSS